MNNYDIPLFRTRATLATATQALTLATMPPTVQRRDDADRVLVKRIDDVTDWVGRDITPRLYAEIVKRVSALGWSMDTVARGDLVHITRLSAKANCDESTHPNGARLAGGSDLQASGKSVPTGSKRSLAG